MSCLGIGNPQSSVIVCDRGHSLTFDRRSACSDPNLRFLLDGAAFVSAVLDVATLDGSAAVAASQEADGITVLVVHGLDGAEDKAVEPAPVEVASVIDAEEAADELAGDASAEAVNSAVAKKTMASYATVMGGAITYGKTIIVLNGASIRKQDSERKADPLPLNLMCGVRQECSGVGLPACLVMLHTVSSRLTLAPNLSLADVISLAAGSVGTPAPGIAVFIPEALAAMAKDFAAGLGPIKMRMTAAVLAPAGSVDVAGGGAELCEKLVEVPGGVKSTAAMTFVDVESLEEVHDISVATFGALAVGARKAGVAVIGLHIDVTTAGGRVVSSKIVMFSEGEDNDAVREGLLERSKGRVAVHKSFAKRYLLTQLHSDWPCCITLVYFGLDPGMARAQRDVAIAAGNFRRNEAARDVRAAGQKSKIQELEATVAKLEAAANADRKKRDEQKRSRTPSHAHDTAASRARSATHGSQAAAGAGGTAGIRGRSATTRATVTSFRPCSTACPPTPGGV